MKISLLQKQALQTASFTLVFMMLIAFILYITSGINRFSVAIFILLSFVFLYLIYNYHMKKFIYRQLKRVYESNLFQNEPFLKKDIADIDFEIFIEKVKKFAENKHLEIEQLHNRDDFRRDFLGDVSHELKTPLFSAQGYLLTILDDSFEDAKLQRKYLERTNKSIERLTYIVKDLDMIAKLESGMKLEQNSFNIVKTIQDVFEILEIKSNKKNIALDFKNHYDYPVLVYADKEKIEQVLLNLISNSINYGKTNGSTLVGIRTKSPQQVLVEITDNGVGIEPSNIPRLFERFYRIDKSRSREQGGSGLGLAIVKHIIEAHKQEVFVDSQLDKGSTFSFSLNKVI